MIEIVNEFTNAVMCKGWVVSGMSLTTKRKLAASLERLLETESISKITVSRLVAESGLSRQSFYNNFLDVYDLINWTHTEHIRHATDIFWENENFAESFEMAAGSMRKHRGFYQKVVRNDGGVFFRENFAHRQIELSEVRICQVTGCEPDVRVRFLLELYWHGTARMLAQWVVGGMKEDPQTLAEMVYEGLPALLRQYWPKEI